MAADVCTMWPFYKTTMITYNKVSALTAYTFLSFKKNLPDGRSLYATILQIQISSLIKYLLQDGEFIFVAIISYLQVVMMYLHKDAYKAC